MSRDALSSHINVEEMLCIEAIDNKLSGLTPINAEERCIFKVHEQLRKVNEKAYEPMLLAIGPYHDHGKVGRGLMEEHKLRYLKQMLGRKNESSVKAYIRTLKGLEERARNCYAEWISLTTYEFVEMMLLDGCFVIELFLKYHFKNLRDEHDPIFQISWMLPTVARDLLLFENQLPFFILTKLFMMIKSSQTQLHSQSRHLGEHNINIEQINNEITSLESSIFIDQRFQIQLGDLAICFLSGLIPFQVCDVKVPSRYTTEKPFQLCQMHKAITPPLAKMIHEHLKVKDKFKNADFKHLLDLIYTMIKLSVLDMELDCAIERHEVGVKFWMGEIFKHVVGLIRRVSPVLAKRGNMMVLMKKSICFAIEHLYGQERVADWYSIPYGKELCEARVEFKMAEKFRDKFEENKLWESIPNAIAFQEAGVDVSKAMELLSSLDLNRNEHGKKKLCGPIFKIVEKFMCLPFLNNIACWNSIPEGRNFKKVGVEFKKAKKFIDTKDMIKTIPNATELKEGGIKFKKAKQPTTFAIQFSKGILEISPLRIEDETETYLRNLIAYEQYGSDNNDSSYITNYMCFIDDLIDSPKDLELLRRKGIIENWLGDDEVASTMVNKLGRHVTVSTDNSLYARTYIDMNKHCAKRWNERKAKLRHDYFHSPWALLSVLAAILLLLLAITQTVFSIIN